MTSPPEQIEIECPTCHARFEAWHRPSINLQLDHFNQKQIEGMTTAVCPECREKIALDCLVVGRDGTWTLGPTEQKGTPVENDADILQRIMAPVGHEVLFKYPGGEPHKLGVLKDRVVIPSNPGTSDIPYWDVVDLISFPEEEESDWIRIGYYRKPKNRLVWASQTTITEPIGVWRRILLQAARQKKWFRDLLQETLAELNK